MTETKFDHGKKTLPGGSPRRTSACKIPPEGAVLKQKSTNDETPVYSCSILASCITRLIGASRDVDLSRDDIFHASE